jgi:hypothetical protein
VEMPLGTPISRFIYDIGEGGTNGRDIKAVQTGGPSGGCIPADMFDTPVDYETLARRLRRTRTGGARGRGPRPLCRGRGPRPLCRARMNGRRAGGVAPAGRLSHAAGDSGIVAGAG